MKFLMKLKRTLTGEQAISAQVVFTYEGGVEETVEVTVTPQKSDGPVLVETSKNLINMLEKAKDRVLQVNDDNGLHNYAIEEISPDDGSSQENDAGSV